MIEVELERTYLAKFLPENLKASPSKEMLDIYLPSTSEHPGLRIRKQGEKMQIIKKRPVSTGDASEFTEESIVLTLEEYAELSTLAGKRIEKTRYYYSYHNRTFEIDVFHGSLEGLVLVDIEFSDVNDKNAFTMPEFCLAEVTQEEWVAGGMICGRSYSDIEPELIHWGYQKLAL